MSGIAVGRRSTETLDRLLAAARRAELSYDHVGSTTRPDPPEGVVDRVLTIEVPGKVQQAATALRSWATHDGLGGRIHPSGAPIVAGTDLIVVLPFGPFELAVPDRIVLVIDEPRRFGLAYGTVATHAEAGEELFLAEQLEPDRLRLVVRIHARPASTLARVGGPAVSALQAIAARSYLRSWADAIDRVR